MKPRFLPAAAAGLLLAGILAAPLFPGIRLAFSAVCHQDPARCLEWLGRPLPVCARCLGIYCGALAAGLAPVRLPAAALSLAAALNGVDWLFGLASNETRFFLGFCLAWPALAFLLTVASRERTAAN